MQSGVYSKLKQQVYEFKMRPHSWDLGNDHYSNHLNHWGSEAGDIVAAGYSWPPRSYSCTFCKREFRSAQALGGHMNVHRRDRARLRHSSPPPRDTSTFISGQFSNPNCRPNPSFAPPNPNPTLSSLLAKFPQFANTLPSSTGVSTKGLMSKGVEMLDASVCEKGGSFGVFKRGEFVRLDLEIGSICDSKEEEEELDLELRLGQN